MEIICEHCQYEWDTESRLNMVTCPNCQKKASMDVGNLLHLYKVGEISFQELQERTEEDDMTPHKSIRSDEESTE